MSKIIYLFILAIILLINSPKHEGHSDLFSSLIPSLDSHSLSPLVVMARKTYLVKESRYHHGLIANSNSINDLLQRPKFHLTASQKLRAMKGGNFFLNKTLEDAIRKEEGHASSPLRKDPRVQQDFNDTIDEEWTDEDFDIVPRDPENITYTYDAPQVLDSTLYYTRPSYTDAFCSYGPDDVQHNQVCLFDYVAALTDAAGTTVVPAQWVFDTNRNAYNYQTGITYQYIYKNQAQWWIDLTLDRLLSERWIISLTDWPIGVFVQALWQQEYDNDPNGTGTILPIDSQFCIDVALVSQKLEIKFQRELQLVQCGSMLVGCLDNLDPFVLWQKNKIFDMCELSPYTTQTVYNWEIFGTDDLEKLWLIPLEQYSTIYNSNLCFPTYLNPLLWFYDEKATGYDLWSDFYRAITSINNKFS